jgi:hypothetical protein
MPRLLGLADDARQVDQGVAAADDIEADEHVDIDAEAVDRLGAFDRIRHVVAGYAEAMCLGGGLHQGT